MADNSIRLPILYIRKTDIEFERSESPVSALDAEIC